jgi:hypothetical protein
MADLQRRVTKSGEVRWDVRYRDDARQQRKRSRAAEGLPVRGMATVVTATGGELCERNRRGMGSVRAGLADTVTLYRAPASPDAFS